MITEFVFGICFDGFWLLTQLYVYFLSMFWKYSENRVFLIVDVSWLDLLILLYKLSYLLEPFVWIYVILMITLNFITLIL